MLNMSKNESLTPMILSRPSFTFELFLLEISRRKKWIKDDSYSKPVIKKSGDWWIGWLIDLPGVNVQEKTQKALLESLKIGAEDMLATEIPFEPGAQMTTVSVSDPVWSQTA
ncbi:conserved hypothetical protein [delta proteobacterium NaphS2]|nr:conserved hypothetical protein [delta proteobacterium NaphS2]